MLDKNKKREPPLGDPLFDDVDDYTKSFDVIFLIMTSTIEKCCRITISGVEILIGNLTNNLR